MNPIWRELLNGLFVFVVASPISEVFVENFARFATDDPRLEETK
jgi:hypothetical protein